MKTSGGGILVVDDDPESLALVTTILTEDGHLVRPADNAELARASVESSAPELVLVDIRMPGMDGLEFCRWLKGRPETQGIPVVFVSGSTGPEERVQGLHLGAVDFLTKPFNTQELSARVRNHLELSRLRSQLEQRVVERTQELAATIEELMQQFAERQRTEHALRESEERFRVMADTAPVMIFTADANQQATFFNKIWRDFTGRTLEQELGTGWLTSVHPDDRERILMGVAASFAARKECVLEYRLRQEDGEYRIVMCRGVPRFELDGTFAGYIGSLIDITQIKRNQEALEEHQQRLRELGGNLLSAQEDANRRLARELHDVFSQELAQIASEVFTLREQANADESRQSLLEIGNRVVRLANELHRTSRKLHPTILDDLGLKHALMDECENFEKRTGIETLPLTENLPDEIPKDIALCLYRVAQESLRNILKHAGQVTAVWVSLSGAPRGLILRIEDNGEGFLPHAVRRKGGLGLVSMEERVRLVNGTFLIRSIPGRGSAVEVWVPIAQLSRQAAH